MAKAEAIPELAGPITFREAAARVVEVRATELFEHAEGVLDTGDIERVHDMRVASRRLRAAMEIFAPCFPKKPLRRVLKDVKGLADALGGRRDPDVHIEELQRISASLTREDAPGIRHLQMQLRDEQSGANAALADYLREIEESDLRGRIAALVTDARAGDGA